jgi:hypothetical protein
MKPDKQIAALDRTRLELGLETLLGAATAKKTYQGTEEKSKQKFEVLGKRAWLVEFVQRNYT